MLMQTLDGIGDDAAQRLFRMQATLCLQRRISVDEQRRLPVTFWDTPGQNLAGGAIELLWESVPGSPSTRPCANPGHRSLSLTDPDLWLAIECGVCDSCRARAAWDGALTAEES